MCTGKFVIDIPSDLSPICITMLPLLSGLIETTSNASGAILVPVSGAADGALACVRPDAITPASIHMDASSIVWTPLQ
jgi:hypothetical protein